MLTMHVWVSKQKNGKVRTRSTALGQLRSKRVMKACINSKLELLNFCIVLCFFWSAILAHTTFSIPAIFGSVPKDLFICFSWPVLDAPLHRDDDHIQPESHVAEKERVTGIHIKLWGTVVSDDCFGAARKLNRMQDGWIANLFLKRDQIGTSRQWSKCSRSAGSGDQLHMEANF